MNLLAGIRVLDLSGLIPGPYASLLLADMGAEVIKVESRLGDLMRQVPPLVNGHSTYFMSLNRNKASVCLDWKKPAGRSLFMDLVGRADVVIEGFRPGRADRMGIGAAACRDRNPGLVYCSISGFGQTGPDAGRAGHDLTYLARSAILDLNRTAGGPPVLPPVQIADFGAGTNAAMAICAALVGRGRTGAGCHLDISMLEGLTAWMGFHIGTHLHGFQAAPGELPLGGRYPFYNVYATSDGEHIALGAVEPLFWYDFCTVIGRPDLAGLQFAEADARAVVHAALAAEFASRTAAAWAEVFRAHDLPAEVVASLDAVLADPHLAARGAFITLEHPAAGRLTQAGPPVRLADEQGGDGAAAGPDGHAPPAATLPPALGADTRRVLAEVLDMDSSGIDNLMASRIVFDEATADPRRIAPEAIT